MTFGTIHHFYDPTVPVVTEASLKLIIRQIEDIAEIIGICGVSFGRGRARNVTSIDVSIKYNSLSQSRSIIHLCTGWQNCTKLNIAPRQKDKDAYLDGLPLQLMTQIRAYRK